MGEPPVWGTQALPFREHNEMMKKSLFVEILT
jgi:hypothetical protein